MELVTVLVSREETEGLGGQESKGGDMLPAFKFYSGTRVTC